MNRLAVPVHQAAETSPMVLGLDVTELLLAVLAVVVVIAAVGFGVVLLGRQRASKREHDLHRDLQEQRQDIERREHRLSEREDRLDADLRHLEDRVAELAAVDTDLETRRAELLDIEEERRLTLERLAGLTAEDARRQLVESIEADAKRTAAILARDIEKHAQEEADERAKRVLATVIQRLASEQTSESVVSIVHLPGDDMKGRIIGREGRNIRSFEQITGVNLIIDDTPEAVLLSCFDPVRREMARLTLEELVADGRIHPTRIEEVHERSCLEVQRLCVRAGEDAAFEMGITDLHPELVATLGKLKYRTSYGQNVLKHLVESGHARGPARRRARPRPDDLRARRVPARHRQGADPRGRGLARDRRRRARAHPRRVRGHRPRDRGAPQRGRAAHRRGRDHPGRRRDQRRTPRRAARVARGVRRAAAPARGDRARQAGVEKVFAMQAGRDVRVMVLPDVVDDIAAQVLARDIAKQFEEELTYPGQIKVTVIRESRATEVAR